MAREYIVEHDGIVLPKPSSIFSGGLKLSSTQFSTIYKIKYTNSNTQKLCVAKMLNKTTKINEYEIVSKLKHQNILSPIGYYKDIFYTIIYFDFVDGCDLEHYITTHGKLEEPYARSIFVQMLKAIDYCHNTNVIHHDVKLENFLIDHIGNVWLIDFGLSVQLRKHSDHCHHYVGTPTYMAPEILRRVRHSCAVDIWALGICLYYILHGFMPVNTEDKDQLYDDVLNKIPEIDNTLSYSANLLILDMLCKSASKRPTAASCIKHSWIVGFKKRRYRSLSAPTILQQYKNNK